MIFAGASNKNTDNTYVLKLLKNMYGLKQAGYNWYNKLTDVLLDLGFKQSLVDKCLFIKDSCIILVYVDDCLLFSPCASSIISTINLRSQPVQTLPHILVSRSSIMLTKPLHFGNQA